MKTPAEKYAERYEAEQEKVARVSITRDQLWDIMAHAFDKADAGDYEKDEDSDYHDYYWCVVDETFRRLKEMEGK